jgi:hypothetical protein
MGVGTTIQISNKDYSSNRSTKYKTKQKTTTGGSFIIKQAVLIGKFIQHFIRFSL